MTQPTDESIAEAIADIYHAGRTITIEWVKTTAEQSPLARSILAHAATLDRVKAVTAAADAELADIGLAPIGKVRTIIATLRSNPDAA